LYLYIKKQTKQNNMKAINILISQIEKLEAKRDAGTMTMDEETLLCRLIEKVEILIYK